MSSKLSLPWGANAGSPCEEALQGQCVVSACGSMCLVFGEMIWKLLEKEVTVLSRNKISSDMHTRRKD